MLVKPEHLKTHQLELQLIDRKRNVFASKDVELKQSGAKDGSPGEL